LEHVVYALARDWGVTVNRKALQVLSNLESSFDQLSGAVIAFASATDAEKARRMKAIQDHLLDTQKRLIQLNFDIHSELKPESTDIPLNVESIVRDIKKQFGRRNKVLKAVDAIINQKLIRKVLDVRNSAAHASTSGNRRELNKSEIDVALELLRTALLLFDNVAFAVADKDAQPSV
jgi:hypothetical protein